METSPSHALHNYEHMAHVIWAAHNLRYLIRDRGRPGLLPKLDHEKEFDADEVDIEIENKFKLPLSISSSKVSNCIAELIPV
jgi:hypothetical protein